MNELKTLVLDTSYRPHRIVGWEEVICLLYLNKLAAVLEEYEAKVSSPSVTLNVPAVVVLRKEFVQNRRGVAFSRMNLYSRDGFHCCYCNNRFGARDLTYDHVMPRSRGGPTNFTNCVAACRPCNRRKGNRTPQEAGMKMHFKPYVPKKLPNARPFLIDADRVPEQWKPYLTQFAEERTG